MSENVRPIAGVDYPNPEQLKDLMKAKEWDLKEMSKLVLSQKCWKPGCWTWNTYFDCQTCGRSFHRKCLTTLGESYPRPQFDVSEEIALTVEFGKAKLIKCPICVISEERELGCLKGVDPVELNAACRKLAKMLMQKPTVTELLKRLHNAGDDWSFQPILDKTEANGYRTIEGFCADVGMLQFRFINLFTEHDEEGENLRSVMDYFDLMITGVKSCVRCVSGSLDDDGKDEKYEDYLTGDMSKCEKPHLVLWIKEPSYPFWPAKVLQVKDNEVYFISFQYSGIRKLALSKQGVEMKEYFGNCPSDEKRHKGRDGWKSACEEALEYWKSCKTKLRLEDGSYPNENINFEGDYEAAWNRQYPGMKK